MDKSDDDFVGSCCDCCCLILDPENHESPDGGVICPECSSTDIIFVERYYLHPEELE